MALKLDMAKVYDRVDCNFFWRECYKQIHKKIIPTIMRWVSTVSYAIMMSAELSLIILETENYH